MPSFNGDVLFGVGVKMTTSINPVARQQTSYARLSGVEELIQGQRGAKTEVAGMIFGSYVSDLNDWRMLWYSYYDGRPYVLVDMFGQVWYNVVLETFQPIAPVNQSARYGFSQMYTAVFFHQTV